jgi:hypothetical protein
METNFWEKAMILIERTLTEQEEKSLEAFKTSVVLNIAEASHQPQNPANANASTALFEWIDHTENHRIDGESYAEYFSVNHYSYWLYVRGRIFYTLFRQAQLLDRLPPDVALNEVEIVYAEATNLAFWQRWTPQAKIIPNPLTEAQSARKSWLNNAYLSALRQQMRMAKQAFSQKFEAVVHSNIFYNEERNGIIHDKALHALLDTPSAQSKILRYELVPLPPKGVKQPLEATHSLPRAYPNVTLDGILATYLMRHPFKITSAYLNLRRLKKRFRGAFRHSFAFANHNETWQKLLQETIQKVATSVVICDLVRQANEWFLAKIKPQYIIGTSENNSLGRAFFEAAKSLQIKTFGIQHGSIDPHNIDYRFRNMSSPNLPDVFFAWGTETRDYLIRKSGYAPENTFAVGRLAADDIGTPTPDATLRSFKANRGKPLLLFASQAQGMFDEYRAAVAPILAQFCQENGLCCIVKPHPREVDDGIYRKAFVEKGVQEDLLEAQGELYAFIAAADFGATCYSTVAWEMLWMDKAIIVFDPFNLDLMQVRGKSFIFFPDESRPFSTWKQDLPHHLAEGKAAAEAKLGFANVNALSLIREQVMSR